MSYTTLVYLFCDFHEPQDAYDHAPTPNAGVSDQRRLAGFDGWTQPVIRGRKFDRCEDCTREKRTEPLEWE